MDIHETTHENASSPTLTTSFGFVVTRKDLFGGVAARGAGQVVVNILVPSLLFSKIVPSFTSDNIRALGPLVLIGTLYEVIGLLLALIVRQFFWVPHRFRYGILAAGAWGNWGDIPTAVIMSITSAAPFNGTVDSDLAVAYIAVFILVFYVTLFPLGGHLLIAKDFEGPDYSDDEVREDFMTKVTKTGHQLASIPQWLGRISRLRSRPTASEDVEKAVDTSSPDPVKPSLRPSDSEEKVGITPDPTVIEDYIGYQPSLAGPSEDAPSSDTKSKLDLPHSASAKVALYAATTMSAPTAVPEDDTILPTTASAPLPAPTIRTPPTIPRRIWNFIKTLNTPPTIAIFVAFPVALVPKIKWLFVPSTLPHAPVGPDGLPPLAFILDTATFIGNASVPLGLICLGSALARLSVPRPWTRLPLGAIGTFTIFKLFLMPVIGVLLCAFFTSILPIIHADDKVLRFVCIFFSAVPTATTQVLLTQVHSQDGNAEHLSAFLVPQYALMFLTMTVLNAYALHLLFG